jgi:hypothetical protein
MIHTHQTAPTQFVEASGIRFAYRRFGNPAGLPLVFNQHFTGTMDHWDPAVIDGLAKEREVILFNNAGVSSSSGEVPTSIEGMAADAIAFIGALGPSKVDVLGFSIGGRTETPRSTKRWHPPNSKPWANGAFDSMGRTTTSSRSASRRWW